MVLTHRIRFELNGINGEKQYLPIKVFISNSPPHFTEKLPSTPIILDHNQTDYKYKLPQITDFEDLDQSLINLEIKSLPNGVKFNEVDNTFSFDFDKIANVEQILEIRIMFTDQYGAKNLQTLKFQVMP